MNLDNQDIGELFRDAFDGFEADVDGNMWNNIQNQVNAGGASGAGAGASGGGISGAMITGIAITSAIIGAGIFYFASGETPAVIAEDNTTPPSEVVVAAPVTNEIPENAIVVERLESPAEADVDLSPEEQLLVETVKSQQNDSDIDQALEHASHQESDAANKFNSARMFTSPTSDYTNGNGTGVTASEENTNNPNNTSASTTAEAQSPPTTTTEQAVEAVDQPIEDAPTAYIESSVVGGYAPLQVSFNSGYAANKYEWDFGNGQAATGNTSEFTFTEPGEYRVTLTTYNADGKADTDELLIEVNSRSDIPKDKIPNVITPNGDGQNDRFAFKIVEIQAIYVAILDISGKIVFESDNTNSLWDGTNNDGTDCYEGTYYYIIKAVGLDGTVIERKGSVTLIR